MGKNLRLHFCGTGRVGKEFTVLPTTEEHLAQVQSRPYVRLFGKICALALDGAA
jgi:hypothetical protein